MRRTVRFGAATGAMAVAASSLLLLRCTGTTIEASGAPGAMVVRSGDPPAVGLQPTWDVPVPTALPTLTPTPIA